jgi:hypothetical protein
MYRVLSVIEPNTSLLTFLEFLPGRSRLTDGPGVPIAPDAWYEDTSKHTCEARRGTVLNGSRCGVQWQHLAVR